jgi:small subunit ribosomal protein S14
MPSEIMGACDVATALWAVKRNYGAQRRGYTKFGGACPTCNEKRLKSRRAPLHWALFMAKTSWINRNERKRATVKKYAALRAELKAKKDYAGLAQLPRDASPTRVVNRCEVTGRRRAFIRRFKVSRLTFRELASQGLIPGVTKSSW